MVRPKRRPVALTQERLLLLFEYRDGKLFRKYCLDRSMKKGERVGTTTSDGYRAVKVDGIQYFEHRLIFLMLKGYLPDLIDHILDDLTEEGCKSNKIENLRDYTASLNTQKRRSVRKEEHTSKYLGVFWNKEKEKWQAEITFQTKKTYIGRYETEVEAAKGYNKRALELFGPNALINKIEGIGVL